MFAIAALLGTMAVSATAAAFLGEPRVSLLIAVVAFPTAGACAALGARMRRFRLWFTSEGFGTSENGFVPWKDVTEIRGIGHEGRRDAFALNWTSSGKRRKLIVNRDIEFWADVRDLLGRVVDPPAPGSDALPPEPTFRRR